jgi:formylglycine-generating enzyme required for sulfatase activity
MGAFPDIPGYRIERQLGEGGMASVYLATQLSLDRPVAIKVVHFRGNGSDQMAVRFEHEARTIARLEHPGIVGIYEVGRTRDGLPYYTMAYLPNGDLSHATLAGEPQRVGEVLRAIAAALGFAHAHGVVHRDVKPENVLFDRERRARLADFGISRSLGSVRVTTDGDALGSSAYMSPEQARGQEVDARSDLYSLGVMAYELLTGHLPFAGNDAVSMALAHHTDAVPRLPATLARWQPLIDRALAKKPEDRVRDAQEFIAMLDRVLQPTGQHSTEVLRTFEPPGALRSRRMPLLLVLVAALLALLATLRLRDDAEADSLPNTSLAAEGESRAGKEVAPVAEEGASAKPASPRSGDSMQEKAGPPMRVIAVDGHAFAIGTYEITRAEYAVFARASGRAEEKCRQVGAPLSLLKARTWREPGFAQDDRHPVVCVSFDDARAYAQWLSRQTNATYRLPTAGEWRAAASGVDAGQSPCRLGNVYGRDGRDLNMRERHDCRDGVEDTAQVGRFSASAEGIHDLAGNVAEWVADCAARDDCGERKIMGSSYRDGNNASLLGLHATKDSDTAALDVGFRVLREL